MTGELAERLEKSEAGRKKLRQAISILQEKLVASEKLLAANETLQKECEQERQRAEGEKKKAEEEKRLRVIMEKDSASVKDQLAKVFQRLGAVENKQKADKKKVERLQNEVKLSTEGMRVAAEAVDLIQSSLQSLESKLVEKVDAASKEARTASEAADQLQSSFLSLENRVLNKGSLPDNQFSISATKPISVNLVDEIFCLFRKEKQRRCKIEQRLLKLKAVLQQDRLDNSLVTAKALDLENLEFPKMVEEKVSKKRKPHGEEELLNWKVRKRSKLYNVNVVNSVAKRSSVDVAKEANEGQSMSSPFLIGYQMTSGEPPRVPNTASNEYIEEAIMNHRGSSNGIVHMQLPPVGGNTPKESQESSFARQNYINSGCDVIKGCLKTVCLQERGIPEIQSEDVLKVMQHRTLDQLAGKGGFDGKSSNVSRSMAGVLLSAHINNADEASDLDLNLDYLDDEWWSERVLLSPSLPDIPSPVHHSPLCSREPSFLKTADATLDLVSNSSAIPDVSVSDFHTSTEAPTNRTNTQSAGMQCGGNTVTVCLKQPEVSLQKNIAVSSSNLQPGSCSRFEELQNKIESGINCQFVQADRHTEVGSKGIQQSAQLSPVGAISASERCMKEAQSLSHGAYLHLDPISSTRIGSEHYIASDKHRQEKGIQINDESGLEAADSASIAQIDNFWEDLPPIALSFSNESCASDLPQVTCADAKPCEVIDPSNEVCTSALPQVAWEMLTLKAINMKVSRASDCSHEESCDGSGLQQSTSGQGRNRETHFVSESPNTSVSQAVSIPSTQPSSSSEVFLLQASDLQGVDAQLNLIAACIMAINFKECLRATTSEKEQIQMQGATLSRASAWVPVEYLACSFISAVVDMARLGNCTEHCNSEAEPVFLLVQDLVVFIRRMFKEKANIILDSTFARLGRFLVQGEAMMMTLYGSLGPYEDVLSFARVFQEQKRHSHCYSEATLADIHAGGKVLAALCQILSCVTHLQNVVYEVLGWCDKDVMWLLTVFSSFSSICGDSAFMVETDDILGHAICAIILELVASVEQELTKTAEGTNHKATGNPARMSSNIPLGLSALKGCLEIHGSITVEQVVPVVFEAIRYAFSSAHDSLAVVSLKNKPLCTKEGCNNDTQPLQGSCFSEEIVKSRVSCQEVSIADETVPKILSERKVDGARGLETWQKKYGEAVGALQLIVHFMGWEWAYNHLIIRYLWREAVSSSTQLCAKVVAHIFSILWRMGVQGGGAGLPGLTELKKWLAHIVQSTLINSEKLEHQLIGEERLK